MLIEGRDTVSWLVGKHSLKFGGAYQRFIWPMVGVLSQSRVLPVYEWIYDGHWSKRWDRVGTGELSPGAAGGASAAGGHSADEPAAVVCRWVYVTNTVAFQMGAAGNFAFTRNPA
jgi:hypothetical protein